MFLTNTILSISSILLGVILIIFAIFVLIRNPESRKLAWPWVVGVVGIVVFAGNSISFFISRIVDVDVDEITMQAENFAARIEESIAPFQNILNIWSFVLAAILIIVAVVTLWKPENREKTWPWVIGVIGLLMLISNGIGLLVQ